MNRWGTAEFQAFSAGSQPRGNIHPNALRVLKGIRDTKRRRCGARLERVRAARQPAAGFCFHPLRPRRRRGLPDLAGPTDKSALGHSGSGRVRRHECRYAKSLPQGLHRFEQRIRIFTALPIETLERFALERWVTEIGKLNLAA